jgi:hypothetical protein
LDIPCFTGVREIAGKALQAQEMGDLMGSFCGNREYADGWHHVPQYVLCSPRREFRRRNPLP